MFVQHLQYFVTLAREKHFARAASACHVAQPTLSAAVRKLEDSLQVPLVVRGHRFQGLTPEGSRLLDWAQQILRDYDSLRQDLSALKNGLSGTLRVGVIPAALPAISMLTGPFCAQHPAVEIDVQSLNSRAIQRGLDNLEIDAGLTYLENEPLEHVRRIPLYRERYVFVARRAANVPKTRTITWKEATQERLCLLSEDMQNRRIINSVVETLGCTMKPSVVSNSFVGVCSHLRRGDWASIVPHTFFHTFVRPPDLVTLDLVDPVHTQSIGLVVSDRDPLSPMAKAFMACAMQLDLEHAFDRL